MNPLKLTPTTADRCFDNPAFTAYWQAIEELNDNPCWDQQPHLGWIVEQFNAGTSPTKAASIVREADESARFDAHMATPSWDR